MNLDSHTTAFVFPGQGSQVLGMGRDLAERYPVAKQTFEEGDSILRIRLTKIMWEGPDADLKDTLNTQPALFIHSMAVFRTFSQINPDFKAAVMAGHSLGELSALAAAGVFSFEAGLRLVRRRGELMKRAGEQAPGGMAAILGLDIPTLEGVCSEANRAGELVQVANDNCPGQVVISGAKSAIERALASAKAAGARRAVPLEVSIAAHSPLMASIQAEWDEAIREVPFSPLQATVIGNVEANPLLDENAARADVSAQMQSRVRWTESVRFMSNMGNADFVEIGTGTVLGGLIKRIVEGGRFHPLGTPEDFDAIL